MSEDINVLQEAYENISPVFKTPAEVMKEDTGKLQESKQESRDESEVVEKAK